MDVNIVSLESTKSATSTATAMPANQPLKTGAKRKLNVRDDDDQPAIADEPAKQDLYTNPRSSDLRMSDDGITKPTLSRSTEPVGEVAPQVAFPSIPGKDGKVKASGASATLTGTARKALGPSKCCRLSQIGDMLTMIQRT